MGGSDDGAGYVVYTWYAKHCLLDDETAETTPKRYGTLKDRVARSFRPRPMRLYQMRFVLHDLP